MQSPLAGYLTCSFLFLTETIEIWERVFLLYGIQLLGKNGLFLALLSFREDFKVSVSWSDALSTLFRVFGNS